MAEALRFGETMEICCDSCGKTSLPSVTYEVDLIKHLCCAGCGNVDAFDFERPNTKKKKAAPVLLNHEVLMERSKPGKLVSYSTQSAYSSGQYLEHAKFGAGYVLNVRNPASKMVVLFEDQKRLLVCEPGPRSDATEKATSDIEQRESAKPNKRAKSSKVRASKSDEEPRTCPVCGKEVHPYNLTQNPKGKVTGCTFCKQSR
jgi:hypothetical protein